MAELDFSRPLRLVAVGDCELAYWRIGEGPDLVLLHGWPLHAATYRNVVAELAGHFTCHLFDLPGAGHTRTSAATRFGFHDSAQAVFNALKTLGIRKYGLVAHDSGGAVARALADLDQSAVTGLMLADTEIPGHHSRQIRSLISMGRHPQQFALFSRLLRFKMVRRSSLGFGGCFHNPDHVDGEFFELFIRPLIEDQSVTRGQLQVLAAMSLREIDALKSLHRRLEMPVQLLWGPDDPFFPASKAREMVADFSNAKIHIFDNGKLFIHEEYPDLFAECVTKFFQAIDNL